jgi:aryl-alcohol dehydrogenase-like predicted oxidoreductase
VEYRKLGDSDLLVSEIALGSWLTYGDSLDDVTAGQCVRAALDLGITLFDTANVYGMGAAERVLAGALSGVERSSYVLATKLYFPMGRGQLGLSAAQIHQQCEASLTRLNTDYIDLYQCHRYDSVTPLAETMQALTEVVAQGKVRYVGFSEWTPDQIREAQALTDGVRFVSSQPQYSMLWRAPEQEVFPLCQASGIGQIVWSPLAQGVLTGKYRAAGSPQEGSRAANSWLAPQMTKFLQPEVLAAAARLEAIATGSGLSTAQLALAWVLREPAVSAAIVGASKPEQLADNVKASGVKLDDATLAAIDEALGAVVWR